MNKNSRCAWTQFVNLTPSSLHWSLASHHLHKVPRGWKARSNQRLKQPNSAANSIIPSNKITRSKLNLPCVECKCVSPQSWPLRERRAADSKMEEAVTAYCLCCIIQNCYTEINNANRTVWTYHNNSDKSEANNFVIKLSIFYTLKFLQLFIG